MSVKITSNEDISKKYETLLKKVAADPDMASVLGVMTPFDVLNVVSIETASLCKDFEAGIDKALRVGYLIGNSLPGEWSVKTVSFDDVNADHVVYKGETRILQISRVNSRGTSTESLGSGFVVYLGKEGLTKLAEQLPLVSEGETDAGID